MEFLVALGTSPQPSLPPGRPHDWCRVTNQSNCISPMRKLRVARASTDIDETHWTAQALYPMANQSELTEPAVSRARRRVPIVGGVAGGASRRGCGVWMKMPRSSSSTVGPYWRSPTADCRLRG